MTPLHAECVGQGPALVLLHGWAMHGGIFERLSATLSSQFTVVTVDLPGHGGSRSSDSPLVLDSLADVLVQTLDAVLPSKQRVVLCGWSLGGLVALATAAKFSDRVRGLGMLAASPRFVSAPDWLEGMDPRVFEVFGEELGRDYRGTLDRFLMLEAQGSAHLREELRYLRDAVYARGEPAPRALVEGLALLHDSDLRSLLPGLAMPSLWVAGRRDRLVNPQAMREAATLAPRSRFLQIDSGGHAPFLTETMRVAEALTVFAADCPS